MKKKIERLNKTDFFDVYGISLLEKDHIEEDNYLLALLLPIAEKYYNITLYALRSECRYFLSSFEHDEFSENYGNKKYYEKNRKILQKRKIKTKVGYRKKLSLELILEMFKKGNWANRYGGDVWADICQECINLKKAIDKLNLRQILSSIDRLNDLEHNNALYLTTYSTFNLEYSLDYKSLAKEEEIFKYCSYDVQKLRKGIKI